LFFFHSSLINFNIAATPPPSFSGNNLPETLLFSQ
jgi:hypothetical protein